MKRITRYRIEDSIKSTGDLERKVSDLIPDGWQPFGGVSVAIFYKHPNLGEGRRTTWSQAMVIWEEVK